MEHQQRSNTKNTDCRTAYGKPARYCDPSGNKKFSFKGCELDMTDQELEQKEEWTFKTKKWEADIRILAGNSSQILMGNLDYNSVRWKIRITSRRI